MNCTKCGSSLPAGADSCFRCGARLATTGQSGSDTRDPKSSNAHGEQQAGSIASDPAPQQKAQNALVRVVEREIRFVPFRGKGIDATYMVLGAIVVGLLLMSLMASYQSNPDDNPDAGTAPPQQASEVAQIADTPPSPDSPAAPTAGLVEAKLAIPAKVFPVDPEAPPTDPEATAAESGARDADVWDVGIRDADFRDANTRASTTSLKSAQLIADAQRILKTRGYDPGPIDGLYGRRTSAAVSRFQSDHELEVDGLIDAELYRQLIEFRPAEKQESGFADSGTGTRKNGHDISADDQRAIQYTCAIRVREFYSSAAFEQCVRKLVAELQGYPLDPTFASLPPAEQQAIDTTCAHTKREHGPGAYNQCVREYIVDRFN